METWPELSYAAWADTRDTLHLWTQMVGKVKLELCPFINQWWETALYLTARGLTTGPIPWQGESFEIDFDFLAQQLVIRVADGRSAELTLEPRSVADFYQQFMAALGSLGITVTITTLPAELPNPVPFDRDTTHAAYDGAAVQSWWRVMLAVGRGMDRFRTPFHGKSSPVHFFWGGFDLNAARFNGQPAPPPSYGGRIMAFGENEANFSYGFWPGDTRYPHAALYAYIVPPPEGLAAAVIQPDAARFDTTLGEFILPYADVRQAVSPDAAIDRFFQSTYEASAALAGWDRTALEGNVPALRRQG